MLSQAAVDAKAEEYSCCLVTIEEELKEHQLEDSTADSVEDAPDSTDPLDEMNDDEDRLACQPAGP